MKAFGGYEDGPAKNAVFMTIHDCMKRRRAEIKVEDLLKRVLFYRDDGLERVLKSLNLNPDQVVNKLEKKIQEFPRVSDKKTLIPSAQPSIDYILVLRQAIRMKEASESLAVTPTHLFLAIRKSNTYAGKILHN